jgi:hypothetical protein
MQDILAIALVSLCGVYALWQGYRAVAGKRSRLGSCCDRGCSESSAKPQETAQKVHFLPSDMLRRR